MTGNAMDIEKATESTFAKFTARLLTPLLLVLLGYFGNRQLNQIEQTQQEQTDKQQTQGEKISTIASDVRVLSARIDYSVVSQVDQLSRRVEQLEKVTKTP